MKFIFGHPPSSRPGFFATKDLAIKYLLEDLPTEESFRYRTTYTRKDVSNVIFSFGGELLGELIISGGTAPNEQDTKAFPELKKVYLVEEIRVFNNRTLRAGDFGLTPNHFGTELKDATYEKIIFSVNGFEKVIKRP